MADPVLSYVKVNFPWVCTVRLPSLVVDGTQPPGIRNQTAGVRSSSCNLRDSAKAVWISDAWDELAGADHSATGHRHMPELCCSYVKQSEVLKALVGTTVFWGVGRSLGCVRPAARKLRIKKGTRKEKKRDGSGGGGDKTQSRKGIFHVKKVRDNLFALDCFIITKCTHCTLQIRQNLDVPRLMCFLNPDSERTENSLMTRHAS